MAGKEKIRHSGGGGWGVVLHNKSRGIKPALLLSSPSLSHSNVRRKRCAAGVELILLFLSCIFNLLVSSCRTI